MTNRSWNKSHIRRDGVTTRHEYEELVSGDSPRVNGKLVLRANSLTHVKAKVLTWSEYGSYTGWNGYTADSPSSPGLVPGYANDRSAAQQQAYNRIRGKLYKGGASLGVTVASLRQSHEMILKRSNLISSAAEELSALASRQKFTKRLADDYLEAIFGWQPLLSDIYNACFTVIQGADTVDYVRGVGVTSYDVTLFNEKPTWYKEWVRYTGTVKCTMAAGVRVTNPNAWLAERAGLINLPAVAWDIVPFSFLINMFTNVGSLVNSITDFYGLSFINSSYTWTMKKRRSVTYDEQYPTHGGYTNVDDLIRKERELTTLAPPRSLVFKVPKMDWSTAAMAASLMVQQTVPVLRVAERIRYAFKHRA